MIPKQLHYVWVGPRPKSDLMRRCMDTWRTILPEYRVVEWNEARCAEIHSPYSEAAMRHGKWAFVSDFVRLYALHQEGGIYLDTDVEITRPLDPFLEHEFFSGYELYDGRYSPITAIMGARPGNPIIASLLADYAGLAFSHGDGLDLMPNTQRISKHFESRFGLRPPYDGTRTTYLDPVSVLYPASHFCTPTAGAPNFAIHHFNGSWLDGFYRRVKLRLPGGYRILRFRRDPRSPSTVLPLLPNERLVARIGLSEDHIFALVRRG